MKMNKVLFPAMFMAFSLISVASFSQQAKPDPEARAKKISEKMKTELSLSEDQYAKVYDINLKYSRQMSGLRHEASEDRKEKMNAFRELNKGKQEELKAVLSEEQMSKYQDLQKKMKHKGRHGHRQKKS